MAKVTSYHRSGHSFAVHLLDRGDDLRAIQELFGYSDGRISMIHSHVFNRGSIGVCSPVNLL